MSNKKRISLLSETEHNEFYSVPKFSRNNREYYFSLSSRERTLLSKYFTYKTKVYLILQLGYFKATSRFYNFSFENVKEDTEYIRNIYFDGKKRIPHRKIADYIINAQKERIAELFDYKVWNSIFTYQAEEHLKELLKIVPKHHDVFRELLSFFEHRKITIPSYRIFQDIFTTAVSFENDRLQKITNTFPKPFKSQLEQLILEREGIGYLGVIKSDQEDFKYTALREEVKKAEQIKEIYQYCKEKIPRLELSKSCIAYYCELTDQMHVSRIRKLSKWKQYLHVMCFVYYRYQQFIDNLIVSFQFHMADILKETKVHIKIKSAEYGTSLTMNWPKVSKLLRFIPSNIIAPEETYETFQIRAYSILPETEYVKLADIMDGIAFDKEKIRWNFYKSKARFSALYLRPIIKNVDFEYREENKLLPKLIYLLKKHLKKGEPLSKLLVLETDFNIPSNILHYMKDSSKPGYLDPFKFELYIYRRMYYAIDHGTLFCNNSVSFKNLQVDLVSDETASKANDIASKFGYPKIPEYCDSRLDELCEELDKAWIKTNENIKNGTNENIKIREDEDCNKFWHLTYEAQPKIEENSFFENLEQIEIAQIIGYIADKTGFWKAFTHVNPKYSKKNLDKEAVKAGILADALGFGISGMSEICDIAYNTLDVNHNNYIRISTLKDASVEVANYIYQLPIFPVWNIEEDVLFADVDGQKHETRRKTIQSRYSSKYFGQKKGISLLSTIVNHYSVNIKAISANDHESHSIFDMIRGNQTDIPIHKVTGDSHSVNQLNFIALDAINVKFVPCLKSIQEQAENIYCISNPRQYEGLIKPKDKVNLNLIRKNKNDIIKVLLSLILQENSQTVIIKKLSSHKRYSRLKSALWEYNKIFRSIHILNLIDDLTLRQNIKKARNRTEAYHQQQKMIRDVYDGMLKGKKIVENQLQAEAIRLVANCIIAYNTILLNDLYLSMVEKYGELETKKIMSRTSPGAWRHIILTGKYNFKSSKNKLDIEQHVEKMKNYIHEHLATKQAKMGVLP